MKKKKLNILDDIENLNNEIDNMGDLPISKFI